MCELEEITRECGAATPGISRVYGIDLDDVVSVPLPNANHTITGNIVLKPGKFFKDIPFVEQKGGFTDEIADAVGGGFKKALGVKLSKYSPQTNKWINSMIGARILVIIADNNDQMILVGNKIAGMRLEKATGSTGQKFGDENGWDLNLVAEGLKPCYFYTGTVALANVTAVYDTTTDFTTNAIVINATNGVTAQIPAASAVIKVKYNKIVPQLQLPVRMDLKSGSTSLLAWTAAGDYIGHTIVYTDALGADHDVTFAAGDVQLV